MIINQREFQFITSGYLQSNSGNGDLIIDLIKLDDVRYSAIIDKKSYVFSLYKQNDEQFLIFKNIRIPFQVVDDLVLQKQKLTLSNTASSGTTTLKAPMPGMVGSIFVAEGEKVSKGQGIMTLEAMKMENEIKSPISGMIKKINVTPKQSVEKNFVLFYIDSDK